MKKSIQRDESAVSPVLGAILMLAIGVTLLSTVQLNFVPVWNMQEDLDHLKIMFDDFKVLKSGIEGGIQSGTTSSLPLSMGFKYSPKVLVYNPKESAYASLNIQENTWAEVRYNEVFPDGMTDDTSIRNVTTSTITYALKGASNYNAFIYEHGLIRRNGSNYTSNSETVLANNTVNLLSVKPLGSETTSSVEKKTVNIYPTSQQKNSVMGENVWLILHTKPEYVNWWNTSLRKEGGNVKKADNETGIVIVYIDSAVIKMGEAYISTASKAAPAHAPPFRIVKVTHENTFLPLDGTSDLNVEIQDKYNNPVPNVQVNFTINKTRSPGNANTGTLLQNPAISGADGRANVILRTSGAGFYYIDASTPDGNKTTFSFPASSQGGVLALSNSSNGSAYDISARLTDVFGNPQIGNNIFFNTSDGTLTYYQNQTNGTGYAVTTLNDTNSTGIKLTNIRSDTSITTSYITWDTINKITVTAQSGYVFNSIDIPTHVNSSGCVRYGTAPGIYTSLQCDNLSGVSFHSVILTNLQSGTAYYFIVNSSRQPSGPDVNSTEYTLVTEDQIPDQGVPPASISGLTNVPGDMFINWTWTDPADLDFDHVQIYIDGIPESNISKGVKFFNAKYFLPGTSHTIAMRTVDMAGRVNSTWVNQSATTTSAYTYVSYFNSTNGSVANPGYAMNASDGLSAILSEGLDGGTILSDRPKSPGKNITNGTQGGGSYNSSYLNNNDLLIDSTNPAVSVIAETRYLMNTAKTGMGGTYWNINGTAGGASDTNTGITISATALKNYTFRPGVNNNKVTGIPGGTPTGYGWVSSIPINAIINAGSWNFQVSTNSTTTLGNGRIMVYIYKFNSTNNSNQWLFSAIGTLNHLGNSSTTENITSGVQPSFTFNSDEYMKIEYWLNVTTGINNAVIRFEANTVTQFVKYGRNSYSLNTTYNFPEANSSPSWQSINIKDNSYADPLANVTLFNATSGQWESIQTAIFAQNTTLAQYVNTVVGASGNASSYDGGSGQIKIRYNWTGSTQNNTLGVDLINVTVTYLPYLLNITANTTGIPETTNPGNHQLQVRYNVSTDTYKLQVWNGSIWNNRCNLNNQSIDYCNYTLLTGEVLQDGNFSGMINIKKYYMLVRYLNQNGSGVQGNLYLDYQRVYSW
jgi:hypothetical protein